LAIIEERSPDIRPRGFIQLAQFFEDPAVGKHDAHVQQQSNA
jgi:hypothetical protein